MEPGVKAAGRKVSLFCSIKCFRCQPLEWLLDGLRTRELNLKDFGLTSNKDWKHSMLPPLRGLEDLKKLKNPAQVSWIVSWPIIMMDLV